MRPGRCTSGTTRSSCCASRLSQLSEKMSPLGLIDQPDTFDPPARDQLTVGRPFADTT